MRRGGYWARLAIDPTDDARAIKRAYAAQLKQIDMDADPAAYIALREARDAALAAAEAGLIDVGGDTEVDGFGHGDAAAPVPFDPSIFETMAPIVVTSGFGAPVLLAVDTAASSDNSVPTVPAPAPSNDEFSLECESVVQPAGETGTPTPLAARMMLIAPAVDPAGRISGDIIIAPQEQGTNYQAHYDALIAMLRLNEEQHPPADFAEQSAMQRHFSVLLADPRMREIGFFAQAERWFANVIARTSPRSDALLEIAATHFAWSDDADTVDQSPEVAWNIARRKTLRFRTEVSQRGHPHHREWRELTTAANENSRRGRGLNRNQVRRFLATIRRDHPSLESEFDWYRVAMWEKDIPTAGKFGAVGVVIYILITIIRVVASDTSTPPSQPSVPSYPASSDNSPYRIAQEEEERRREARDMADSTLYPDLQDRSVQIPDTAGEPSTAPTHPPSVDRPAPARRARVIWKPPVCPPIEENPEPSTPAKECGSGNWFVDGDYPESAVRRGKQGVVRIKATVGTDGTLSSCKVEQSSGDDALDSTTCNLVVRRARFTPARDAESKPTESSYSLKMTWTLTH